MKSLVKSVALMYTDGRAAMLGSLKSSFESTRGPQALSWMRRGAEAGGRKGLIRDIRWCARRMLPTRCPY